MKILTKTNLLFSIPVFLMLSACNRPTHDQRLEDKTDKTMVSTTQEEFGKIGDEKVMLFTLENENGMRVKVTNYGGIVTSLQVPAGDGELYDVVLGFDSLGGYLGGHPYFGCLVGRYANRIAEGKFTLDGKTYTLATNNGENHLHGGTEGFDKKIWDAVPHGPEQAQGVEMRYLSPAGEEGYPGAVKVKVIYTLTHENELKIDYHAYSDAKTIINLTNHCYFNLNGQGNGDILNHLLYVNADRYTPVNDHLIPTGELRKVENGPFDFREQKPIGRDISLVPGGYDHNYVLNGSDSLRLAARLNSPSTGIQMEVYTDQPGMQFYTGNFLDGSLTGKEGKVYEKHYGLCLETQHFPDSPNQPGFPSTVLEPEKPFESTTIYKFSK
jgi:aldose 1-epimerase